MTLLQPGEMRLQLGIAVRKAVAEVDLLVWSLEVVVEGQRVVEVQLRAVTGNCVPAVINICAATFKAAATADHRAHAIIVTAVRLGEVDDVEPQHSYDITVFHPKEEPLGAAATGVDVLLQAQQVAS